LPYIYKTYLSDIKNSINFLFISILILPTALFSQEFQTALYFEDALGNRDTVNIAFDPMATDSIDLDFGEVNLIDQPLSDGLDIRMVQAPQNHFDLCGNEEITLLDDKTSYTTEDIVAPYDCPIEFYIDANSIIKILIPKRNIPVTCNWDSSAFNIECIQESKFYIGERLGLHIGCVQGQVELNQASTYVFDDFYDFYPGEFKFLDAFGDT